MTNLIAIHADFEAHWSFVAERFFQRWHAMGQTELIRLPRGDERTLGEVAPQPWEITRLACLGVPVTTACVDKFTALREAVFADRYGPTNLASAIKESLTSRGVKLY